MRRYYPYLDLLKFLCCIGIVSIHTEPFHYIPFWNDYFIKLQPVFVAIFFIVSSSLFWRRINWNSEDVFELWHFIRRLLILVLFWGIILSPHWIPKFIRHNPENWEALLLPKILLEGFAQGTWFILSLIYGILLCYILNRYLNKHIVFFLALLFHLYYSFVHYEGMNDFLNIYWKGSEEGFHFDSYCSVFRSFVWIEYGLYLIPVLINRIPNNMKILVIFISLIGLAYFDSGYFLFMSVIAVFVPSLSMTRIKPVINQRMSMLRKMSIIIYFSQFPIVTTFHMLYLRGVIPYEYGLLEFLITFTMVSVLSFVIIKSSERYKFLGYLY